MPWRASVSPCSNGHATSRYRQPGMVESCQKASDASGEAGSQQGCPHKGTPGKDMWVRSSTEGNVLHGKMQGTGPRPRPPHRQHVRKLGTRILLPPALLSKQQDSPQLPQWIVNPFRTTQAHQTRSVLFT